MNDASSECSDPPKPPDSPRFRFPAASRLLLALATTVALCAALTMTLQDRSLTADLEQAARNRLARHDPSMAGDADADLLEAALQRSRMNLFFAGSIAVGLSFVVCAFLARGRTRRQAGWQVERQIEELRRSQTQLANAQEMAGLGSFELDFEKQQATVLCGSDPLRGLFQVERGEAPLDAQMLLSRVHPDDREDLREAVRSTLEGGATLHSDFRIQRPDGSERIVHAQARLSQTCVGLPRLEGTVQDITLRRRAAEQIRFLAHHDSLTGLGNRRLFDERLGLAITHARRRRAKLGVLFLGLDHFARINDSLGRRVGDEVLRQVAERLVQSVRASDLVALGGGVESAVSRLAGDEFTLLLGDIGDAEELAFVAMRILVALSRPLELGGQELALGASIGIAAWPGDGEDAETLLRNAGSAMHDAKEHDASHYRFYDESMNATAAEFMDLASRMRVGLARGEFEMHYQARVALEGGLVTGFEALLRWPDPELGMRYPGGFVSVAERCGLIEPLGVFAMRAACVQLAQWQRARPDHAVPKVAVNLSAHQFKRGNLVETVTTLLQETGARPELLELEITESAVAHDEQEVVADLEQLRRLGIGVSLDGFGSGQSSLGTLRRLPVDTLKIDRSLVRNIPENEADARLAAAIVGMGHAHGLCVVAEGVETESQRELLAGWGCDEIQGSLVSPAVPAVEAIALLDAPRGEA